MKRIWPLLLALSGLASGQVVPPTGGLPPQAGNTLLGNATSGSTAPTALAIAAINLQWLGACGIADATTIFNAAAATAATTKQAIYIPNGCTVNHSSTLTLNGLQLIGDGLGSVLEATDMSATPYSALYIEGNGVVVKGINFEYSGSAARSVQVYSAAIAVPYGVGATLTNFKILDNYITSAFAGPGISIDYAGSHGEVAGNSITGNVEANPIWISANTALPVNYIDLHDNDIQGGGDNCIEVVDYSHSAYSLATYINVHNNQLYDCGAAGVAFLGASDSVDANNTVVNATTYSHYIASEVSSTESPANNDSIIGNIDYGAAGSIADIFVNGSQVSGSYFVYDTLIENNEIHVTGAAPNGILIGNCCASATIYRTSIIGNNITGSGSSINFGIQIDGGDQDVLIADNTISGLQETGVVVASANNSGNLNITGNHFANLSNGSQYNYAAINVANGASGFSNIEITSNSFSVGTNGYNFLVCTGNQPLIVGNEPGLIYAGCTGATDNGPIAFSALSIAGSSTGTTLLASADASATNYTATLPANTGTVPELNLAQTWSAAQTFPSSDVVIGGSSTGTTALASANASATNYTKTLTAATGTVIDSVGISTGLAVSSGTVTSNAESTLSYNYQGAAITNTVGNVTKVVKASTVDNVILSADSLTCGTSPTFEILECGTSTTCASPTTIASAQVTTAGTSVSATVSSSAITAGDYVGWKVSAGTCTVISIYGNAQIHSN